MGNTSSLVHSLIAQRRTVRTYADTPIPDAVLDRVVSSALEAPSAFNLQLRDVVVVTDPALRQALTDSSGQPQFAAAPAVLVFVGRSELWPEDAEEILGAKADYVRNYKQQQTEQQRVKAAIIDATLAAGTALIAAQAEGLVTNPTTGWDEHAIKDIIGLGDRKDRSVAVIVAMGYPDPAAPVPAHPGRQADRRVSNSYAK
ncbi:NADH dehydrogenase [Corynebacterium ciconiae DSM 44920]|uniref:nitroreductase family protein n=1 Tax=Corynebacterium ciconiae TaxID=227319 RepID=UPI00058EF8CF|nr:nitroreductase family protein [Corynebacterium ciconiae]WKD61761.1 NADH dehydrogenase [Corynebacterium ciconiae DSM 44920]